MVWSVHIISVASKNNIFKESSRCLEGPEVLWEGLACLKDVLKWLESVIKCFKEGLKCFKGVLH